VVAERTYLLPSLASELCSGTTDERTEYREQCQDAEQDQSGEPVEDPDRDDQRDRRDDSEDEIGYAAPDVDVERVKTSAGERRDIAGTDGAWAWRTFEGSVDEK
jgi:hypothetical protein